MDNFRDSYFQVDWDLTTKRLRGTYWGKQYDTGRGFAVTVINGGQVVAPTNEVLRLKWEKPDNTTGYVNATIVNGKFIVENIDQMFTVHGSVRADFELSVGGESVASITFYVNVEKAVAVDAIESSSDFTALQDAVGSVDSLQQQFNNVVANVTVDSEVIAARGTEATLAARLDSADAKLNDYTTQNLQSKYLPNKVNDTLKNTITLNSDGTYTVDVKTKQLILSGNEQWVEYSSTTEGFKSFYLVVPDKKIGSDNLLINKLELIPEVWGFLIKKQGYSGNSASRIIYIKVDINNLVTPDIQGFRTWVLQNSLVINYELEVYENFTLDKLSTTALELFRLSKINDTDNKLMLDISNTKQQISFNANGTVQKITHKKYENIVREDVFEYQGNLIIETRTLSSGDKLIYKYNLDTLEMEVI